MHCAICCRIYRYWPTTGRKLIRDQFHFLWHLKLHYHDESVHQTLYGFLFSSYMPNHDRKPDSRAGGNILNPYSVYPGTVSGSMTHSHSVYPATVSGSMTRSHSVYPVTVTLLQPAVNIHSLILLRIVRVVSLRPSLIQNRCPRPCSSPQWL